MLLLNVFLLVVGFLILIKGADYFVDGAAGVATKFGIPQLIIGLTIVAMGTSAPEAAVSITAAAGGNADITIGNVVGSNIFNILLVIGLAGVFSPNPIKFENSFIIDGIVAVVSAVLLWLLIFKDKKLRKSGGIIMLCCYAIYFTYLLIQPALIAV